MDTHRSFGGEDAAVPPRKQKAPKYRHTDEWEGTCPQCGHEFNQENVSCPIDHSYLVVRQYDANLVNGDGGFFSLFFLISFQPTRGVRQELRCSSNDGFHTTSVGCPKCGAPVQGDYLRGIYIAPRRILYVPFVLLLSLGVVGATSGLAILLWPFVTESFRWIYSFFLSRWPLRLIFYRQARFSFYDTNEARQL